VGTAVTGEGFDAFKGRRVGGLSVAHCPLTVRGLERIGDLGYINSHLGAESCGIGDEGLAQFARHTELKRMYLEDNPITDAGLVRLEALKSLEELRLGKTKVTAAGVAKLQQALPKCKITWDGEAKK
jgi:hypothetical protein